jgi:hypothetical protein
LGAGDIAINTTAERRPIVASNFLLIVIIM